MPKKSKKNAKKKATGAKKAAKRRATVAAAPLPAAPPKRRSSHRAHVPAGMTLVPTSTLHKKRPKKRHPTRDHHPHKDNPEPEKHSHLKQAGAAVGFGLAAAVVGLAGGWALSKAGMTSKAANVTANIAAATLMGGGLGFADRTAGTIVAHNYLVAAGQVAMAPSGGGAVTSRAPQRLAGGKPTGAPATRQLPAKTINAADELDGYEKLEGVIADNFAGPDDDFGDDLDGYEKLEGIIADNFAGPDDDLGDDFESLDDDA